MYQLGCSQKIIWKVELADLPSSDAAILFHPNKVMEYVDCMERKGFNLENILVFEIDLSTKHAKVVNPYTIDDPTLE